jgi:hypothetical protein
MAVRDWLGVERHKASRQTVLIVAVAAVIILVATAGIAVWMHLAITRHG